MKSRTKRINYFLLILTGSICKNETLKLKTKFINQYAYQSDSLTNLLSDLDVSIISNIMG